MCKVLILPQPCRVNEALLGVFRHFIVIFTLRLSYPVYILDTFTSVFFIARLPVVYSWQALMRERFHKLQREHYDDLKSSEEVIEEDEDTLEVMKSIMEIVSWFT